MKHKWHDEIVAWAGGAEIDAKSADNWFTDDYPSWNNSDYEFRVKPQPKEKKYLYVYKDSVGKLVFIQDDLTINGWILFGKIEVLDD